MNIIKNCKDCELTSDSCGVVCMSDIQSVPEKTAAAPSPSVPAVESWPPVPALIAGLVTLPDGFDPFSTFQDFSELIRVVRASPVGVEYHRVITLLYDMPCDFPDLTVAQIVSAIYAVAEEQSK